MSMINRNGILERENSPKKIRNKDGCRKLNLSSEKEEEKCKGKLKRMNSNKSKYEIN